MSNLLIVEQITIKELQDKINAAVQNGMRVRPPQREDEATSSGRLLTRDEAAKALRISVPTLQRRVKDGTLKPLRIGSRTLFRQRDIEAFIDAQNSTVDGRER